MSIDECTMQYANFNITFGKNNNPMLTHFLDIIWPAFRSEYYRAHKDGYPKFYVSDVELKEVDDDLILVGNYIKETIYDIKTTIQDGELIPSPSRVPTAPYSRFIVFLKNHRMILVRNEVQSPDTRSFQTTVRMMIENYIKVLNSGIKKKEDKFPQVSVNIVDIPLPQDIAEVLHNVKKVSKFQLRFFPLNNDINAIPLAQNIDAEMKRIGSKHAQMRFSSPSNVAEVENIMDQSAGLAVATLEVIDGQGNKAKINRDNFRSSKKIPFSHNIEPDDDAYIIKQAEQDNVINIISEDNRTLFEQFKDELRKLLP